MDIATMLTHEQELYARQLGREEGVLWRDMASDVPDWLGGGVHPTYNELAEMVLGPRDCESLHDEGAYCGAGFFCTTECQRYEWDADVIADIYEHSAGVAFGCPDFLG